MGIFAGCEESTAVDGNALFLEWEGEGRMGLKEARGNANCDTSRSNRCSYFCYDKVCQEVEKCRTCTSIQDNVCSHRCTKEVL